jgi:hypothetical protein
VNATHRLFPKTLNGPSGEVVKPDVEQNAHCGIGQDRPGRKLVMNLMSGNIVASQRDILGLPVCDLGWAEAFAFAEEVATMPFGQSVIAFINAGNANLMMRDPEYRAVLERQIVLPDGHGVDIASMLFHGRKFPANLTGTDFVPALLTYLSRPMRVAMIGAQQETLIQAAENFRRHAPWHTFLPISDGLLRPGGLRRRHGAGGARRMPISCSSPWAARRRRNGSTGMSAPAHARLVLRRRQPV